MLYLCYLCRFKPLRDHLRGFLIAAWAGDKIAEFSFPEISFHFPLRPWFFFVSPAYAGKSPARFSSPRRCRDHPRVCGEKFVQFPLFLLPSRITPAYAGKSPARPGPRPWRWDHPRVCGEKVRYAINIENKMGSPPRMRGKACVKPCCLSCVGITPAYAGKRVSGMCWRASGRDHPRVCGEKNILCSLGLFI